MTPEKRQTFTLCIVLIILLIVLLMLVLAVGNTFITPAMQNKPLNPNELLISEGMSLQEAKDVLDANKITYSILPTQSRVANRVEKIEYSSTSVKLYANEIGKDKVVYLTFDDGPIVNYSNAELTDIYHTTEDILDTLDGYGIKATFFIVGYQMTKNDRSQYVIDTLDRGHLIACHSSTHELNQIYSSPSQFVTDIKQYESELKEIIGEERYNSLKKYIRFPGGTSTNGKLSKTEAAEYIAKVRDMGYKVYDWTALTKDKEGFSTTSEFISCMLSGLTKAKTNEEPLIVLMHDMYSTSQSLPAIIDCLISEGYYFDTIDNCPEYTFVEN